MKRVCIFLIKLYRRFFSPMKRRAVCRFYPTCSLYAIEAFETHGFLGGLFLSTKRILRCNPFCRGGIDYVPQKIELRIKKKNNSLEND